MESTAAKNHNAIRCKIFTMQSCVEGSPDEIHCKSESKSNVPSKGSTMASSMQKNRLRSLVSLGSLGSGCSDLKCFLLYTGFGIGKHFVRLRGLIENHLLRCWGKHPTIAHLGVGDFVQLWRARNEGEMSGWNGC